MSLALRCALAGLFWAAVMFAVVADGPRTLPQAAVFLGGGVFFGLFLYFTLSARERRLFGDLTATERAAAIDAVRSARPPADPRLRDAATRLARQWAARRMRPAHHLAVFGFFLAVSIYVAVAVNPWGWLGLLFWPAAAWLSIRDDRRRHRAAGRFLAATSPEGYAV